MKSAKCQLQHRLVALGCPSVALVAPYCGASKPSFPSWVRTPTVAPQRAAGAPPARRRAAPRAAGVCAGRPPKTPQTVKISPESPLHVKRRQWSRAPQRASVRQLQALPRTLI